MYVHVFMQAMLNVIWHVKYIDLQTVQRMNKVVLTHREQRNSFQFIGPLEAKIEAIWLLTMSGHARQLLIKKKKKTAWERPFSSLQWRFKVIPNLARQKRTTVKFRKRGFILSIVSHLPNPNILKCCCFFFIRMKNTSRIKWWVTFYFYFSILWNNSTGLWQW